MNPTVSFKTIGCRLNQAETAAITASFTNAGYQPTPFGTPCDVTLIHGCAITGKAEHSSLYAARQAKRTTPGTLVILAGCPAETLGSKLTGNPSVDLVVGQIEKFSIPEKLHLLQPDRFPHPPAQPPAPPVPHFETQRALIKVQDGCDFHCAYCIVPTARGNPVSRPLLAIRDEVNRVTEAGFTEIILTGANLGRYQDGTYQLVDLIKTIETIPGLKRIRLSSIEITTTESAIIDHMATSSKLCHFLHIPLQSGDDGILAAMGRRYDSATFRKAIDHAVHRIPDLGLGTDIIVGFPGEDERAFNHTVSLVRDLPFSNLHVFPYSRRSGTRADTMAGQIPDTKKKERVQALTVIGETQRRLYAESFKGKQVDVLIERVDQEGNGHGWTGQYVQARLQGAAFKPRQIASARVTRSEAGTLEGIVTSCDDR
jgi:threonylcarbamoyladenosine tRNA methylthiotransferase MtaB